MLLLTCTCMSLDRITKIKYLKYVSRQNNYKQFGLLPNK